MGNDNRLQERTSRRKFKTVPYRSGVIWCNHTQKHKGKHVIQLSVMLEHGCVDNDNHGSMILSPHKKRVRE